MDAPEPRPAADSAAIRIEDLPPLREAPAPPVRVRSVSPTVATPEPAPPGPGGEVFLSPRVIDEAAFDELAGTLRGLVDQAEEAARRLAESVRAVATLRDEPTALAGVLHDRLRIGAQMLQALDAQLARVHEARSGEDEITTRLDAVEARIAERLASLDRAIDAAGDRLRDRLGAEMTRLVQEVRSEAAAARAGLPGGPELRRLLDAAVDEARRSIAECADRAGSGAGSAEVRLAALQTRLAALEQRLDDEERRLADASDQLHDAGERAAIEAKDAEAAAAHCIEARRALEAEIARAGAATREVARRAERATRSADERIVEAERRAERLSALVELASPTADRLGEARRATDGMAGALAALEPWERLLAGPADETTGLPVAVATIVATLREEVGGDLERVAASLRDAADRVAAMARPAPPARRAEISTTVGTGPLESATVEPKPLRFPEQARQA